MSCKATISITGPLLSWVGCCGGRSELSTANRRLSMPRCAQYHETNTNRRPSKGQHLLFRRIMALTSSSGAQRECLASLTGGCRPRRPSRQPDQNGGQTTNPRRTAGAGIDVHYKPHVWFEREPVSARFDATLTIAFGSRSTDRDDGGHRPWRDGKPRNRAVLAGPPFGRKKWGTSAIFE